MRCTPIAKFHSREDAMFRHRKCKELLIIRHHGDLTTPNNWCGAPTINLLHPGHLGGEMTSHPSDESGTVSDGLDRLPRPDRPRWVHELAVLLIETRSKHGTQRIPATECAYIHHAAQKTRGGKASPNWSYRSVGPACQRCERRSNSLLRVVIKDACGDPV
jgi:hypothetical protein